MKRFLYFAERVMSTLRLSIRKNIYVTPIVYYPRKAFPSSQGRTVLGRNSAARAGTKIVARKDAVIDIGPGTTFNYNCIVTARKKIAIGKRNLFGPGVQIFDHDHDYHGNIEEYTCAEINIGDINWFGANCIVLKGTTIGSNCVIAAGTIVRGNIPDNSLVHEKKEIAIKPIQRD